MNILMGRMPPQAPIGKKPHAYLAITAAFLSDIAFKRAHLTTQLINVVLVLIGSAATAVIC